MTTEYPLCLWLPIVAHSNQSVSGNLMFQTYFEMFCSLCVEGSL